VPARKMRVEVYDDAGNRYAITFDGRVTRDEALRIFDMVELLGGMPSVGPDVEGRDETSKISRVNFLVEKNFPGLWFTPKDARLAYESEFSEPISLSTISTYLSRLATRGLLLKERSSHRIRYRLFSQSMQRILSLKNPT